MSDTKDAVLQVCTPLHPPLHLLCTSSALRQADPFRGVDMEGGVVFSGEGAGKVPHRRLTAASPPPHRCPVGSPRRGGAALSPLPLLRLISSAASCRARQVRRLKQSKKGLPRTLNCAPPDTGAAARRALGETEPLNAGVTAGDAAAFANFSHALAALIARVTTLDCLATKDCTDQARPSPNLP